jgi:uncharacterized membrane protein
MDQQEEADEPRQSELNRVEAFSDGVIAIIVTIMVLELKVPHEASLHGLLTLQPIFLAYALSFTYVAIYWVNHHRLFTHARRVTNGLLWSNMALLFTLSLIPFATAFLGEHHFESFSARLYLATLVLPALTYTIMQGRIELQSGHRKACQGYLAATRRKGYVSTVIYLASFALSFVHSQIALIGAVIVAILWIVPQTPLDRLFARK